MSVYPATAYGQGLYESSSTRKAKLGTEIVFDTTQGPVCARYMSNANAATLASGYVVAHASAYGGVDTAPLAATNAVGNHIAGVLCATMAISGYGWVAYKGPVTALALATTKSSTVNGLIGTVHSAAANLSYMVSSIASGVEREMNLGRAIGRFGGATTNIATSGGAGPLYLNLHWR